MSRNDHIPNIVADENYMMMVNRLTRRYAERGASAFTDAEALKQERSDARARAIAPEAYRISKTLGDNPEMYKSGMSDGGRYMTTDDYLIYFSKCHDTFDAVNYYDLHLAKDEDDTAVTPRILVHKKRLAMTMRELSGRSAERQTRLAREGEPAAAAPESRTTPKAKDSRGGRRAISALAAVAASLTVIVGSVFAVLPANGADEPINLAQVEDDHKAEPTGLLQNKE